MFSTQNSPLINNEILLSVYCYIYFMTCCSSNFVFGKQLASDTVLIKEPYFFLKKITSVATPYTAPPLELVSMYVLGSLEGTTVQTFNYRACWITRAIQQLELKIRPNSQSWLASWLQLVENLANIQLSSLDALGPISSCIKQIYNIILYSTVV